MGKPNVNLIMEWKYVDLVNPAHLYQLKITSNQVRMRSYKKLYYVAGSNYT